MKTDNRFESIDLLRGLAMMFMAQDHVRTFFYNARFSPADLQQVTPAFFITRLITHPVAPIFVFIAGTSAFISLSRGRKKSELSFFLFTRGALLILLEFTLVHLGWNFSFSYAVITMQVIWAIGCSMIVLSILIFLPVWAIAIFGITMIAGHNLFDRVCASDLGAFGWLWTILHQYRNIKLSPQITLKVLYPLIPWIGVMAAGYGAGVLFQYDEATRRRWAIRIGTGLILIFLLLRSHNLYGYYYLWSIEGSTLYTVFSFFNCSKYPPSLHFLLMTLGPALITLGLIDLVNNRAFKPLLIFGRVPLFFYIIHIPIIHAMAVGFFLVKYGNLYLNKADIPNGYGLDLLFVNLLWIFVLLIVYPICRWYDGIKQERNIKWLRYL